MTGIVVLVKYRDRYKRENIDPQISTHGAILQVDLNPSNQVDLNPSHQVNLNPSHQVNLNPSHQVDLNPSHQVDLNPSHQVDLNPSHLVDRNPSHCFTIGPHFAVERKDSYYSERSHFPQNSKGVSDFLVFFS
ncbi:hypothetical protein CDAR_30291 [Caerostris darwini]|uniref:Uncharacterized protein n=1 Tax=Caerostris darwini TaxID=1538125 RepID=A0AAV4SPG6_9ARAC|nr:hypothetical protein CDAR_30291 [Caerostris darwini]